MKHSIRKQFAWIFIGMMAAGIAFCWILNTVFLETYYTNEKEKDLLEAYGILNEAALDETLDSEEFAVAMQDVGNRYNLEAVVLDVSDQTIKSFGTDPERVRMQLLDNLFLQDDPGNQFLEETENYRMKIICDMWTGIEHLELWGNLENGDLFLLRTPLESIRDSVRIANRFLAYVGLLSAAASGIVIWLITKKVTDPIMELAGISRRMANLDFEARYSGNSRNEIGMLGDNINHMSEELKKNLSELKKANNELQKDIQKKKELERMRTEFLSNVSHELKTPIALIRGYAEGLMEGIYEDEESCRFYCSVIMDESARMNDMVKKLMDLNQLEFGDEVDMERFDITALIMNHLQSVEILIKQKGISLKMQADAPVYVWGDEFKTGEVFVNYITNAIHHAEKENIIEVSLEIGHSAVRVKVFNTGHPIPEESLPRIWDKFYKVDKARTREYGGSGVGLSIVKAIMESMNQNYGVENYKNGVLFWFELEKA